MSFWAVFARRDSNGKRRRESTITRSRGRRRGRPLRSVSSGSSAMIVPTPTRMASLWCRSCCTRDLAGDPAAGDRRRPQSGGIPGLARGRRDLAVEGHRGFQSDQRDAAADVVGEGLVDVEAVFDQQSGSDRNSGFAQALKPAAADQRVGIEHAGDHAANAGGDDGVGTRGRTPLVGAGLEIDIQGRAPGARAGLLEGEYLGVLKAVVNVRAGADDLAVLGYDHCAHVGVGRGQPDASPGEFKRLAEEVLVVIARGHGSIPGSRLQFEACGARNQYLLGPNVLRESPPGSATPLRPLGPRRTGAIRDAKGPPGIPRSCLYTRESFSKTPRSPDDGLLAISSPGIQANSESTNSLGWKGRRSAAFSPTPT